MKYLLDTHAVIWLFENSPRLSSKAKAVIMANDSIVFVSIASAWEFAIKTSINKLKVQGGVTSFLLAIADQGFQLINILPWHLEGIQSLPFIHRDPFDRMLIATAKTEGMTLVTADENIHRYGVPWVW